MPLEPKAPTTSLLDFIESWSMSGLDTPAAEENDCSFVQPEHREASSSDRLRDIRDNLMLDSSIDFLESDNRKSQGGSTVRPLFNSTQRNFRPVINMAVP